VQVKLSHGEDIWLLIHLEVQSQVEATFTRRMFVSNYRLFDRYGIEVISLGVLADEQSDWRPQEYGYGRWGSEMRLHFPVVKLLDYAEQWAELEQSTNPFAAPVPVELADLIQRLADLPQLKALLRQAVMAGSLEEFERFVETGTSNPTAV
jgi:hypothetical protein